MVNRKGTQIYLYYLLTKKHLLSLNITRVAKKRLFQMTLRSLAVPSVFLNLKDIFGFSNNKILVFLIMNKNYAVRFYTHHKTDVQYIRIFLYFWHLVSLILTYTSTSLFK